MTSGLATAHTIPSNSPRLNHPRRGCAKSLRCPVCRDCAAPIVPVQAPASPCRSPPSCAPRAIRTSFPRRFYPRAFRDSDRSNRLSPCHPGSHVQRRDRSGWRPNHDRHSKTAADIRKRRAVSSAFVGRKKNDLGLNVFGQHRRRGNSNLPKAGASDRQWNYVKREAPIRQHTGCLRRLLCIAICCA